MANQKMIDDLKAVADEMNVEVSEPMLAIMDTLQDALACRIAYALAHQEGPEVIARVVIAMNFVADTKGDMEAVRRKQQEERDGQPVTGRMVS